MVNKTEIRKFEQELFYLPCSFFCVEQKDFTVRTCACQGFSIIISWNCFCNFSYFFSDFVINFCLPFLIASPPQ